MNTQENRGSEEETIHQLLWEMTTISKGVLEEIKHDYPLIYKKAYAVEFLVMLAKTNWKCRITGGRVFSRKHLARLLGKHESKAFLERFLEDMQQGPLPELQWERGAYKKEQCTVIKQTGVEPLMQKIVTDISVQRVYADFHTRNRKRRMKSIQEIEKLVRTLTYKNPDAQTIASYLHAVPYQRFELDTLHFAEAITLANEEDKKQQERAGDRLAIQHAVEQINESRKKIGSGEPISSTGEYQLNLLFNLRDFAKPFYHAVENSPRLFGTELTYLKTKLRKALHPEWIDFDLKSCQFVLATHLFRLPNCLAFLATEASIWNTLASWMGLQEERRAEAKPFLKRSLYSILFRMQKRDANELLERDLAPRGIFWNKSFSMHPLIQEIDQALRKVEEEVKEKGGMQGIHTWVPMEKGREEKSVLSSVIQEYELYSIAACYEIARKEKEMNNANYTIMLHQHDGFSLELSEGADPEKIREKFQKGLETKLRKLHLGLEDHMKIEYK